MSNVLDTIIADKKQEIEALKVSRPIDPNSLLPSTRQFKRALADGPSSFLLECKQASPSKGTIRSPFDLDEIMEAYSQYASCVSVLTDKKYFQGDFSYLQHIASTYSLPCLNKDFFISPYQVHLARSLGADAVLLMLSVLDDEQFRNLYELAQSYHMDVLTEVSNEQEVDRALQLGVDIVGINNRDLRDLSTDLATTPRLVARLKAGGFKGVILSESGIYTHADVQQLAPLVDGFLVGSSLMAEPDLKLACARLIYGETKICGVTKACDIDQLSRSPVTYLGLIFAPNSPRYLSLADATDIVTEYPARYVGVFTQTTTAEISDHAKHLRLHAVQLHYAASKQEHAELRATLPSGCEIWQVISLDVSTDLAREQLATQLSSLVGHVDRVLFDSQSGQHTGGTGQTFNWTQLPTLTSWVQQGLRFGLAGGLEPNNIRAARRTQFELLDINSGIESSPGVKDATLVNALFAELRTY